jgi:hypothetical protein
VAEAFLLRAFVRCINSVLDFAANCLGEAAFERVVEVDVSGDVEERLFSAASVVPIDLG